MISDMKILVEINKQHDESNSSRLRREQVQFILNARAQNYNDKQIANHFKMKNKNSIKTKVARFKKKYPDEFDRVISLLSKVINNNKTDNLSNNIRKNENKVLNNAFDKSIKKAAVIKRDPITDNQNKKKVINNNETDSQILVITDYEKYIAILKNHPDIPYSSVILDRCEGNKKRDRSLVKAILSTQKLIYKEKII